MNTLTFTQTRSRSNDCDTSKAAAIAAVGHKADMERAAITAAVKSMPEGLTAREVAHKTGIEYIECQRRISECGLTKTSTRRCGCAVWSAVN